MTTDIFLCYRRAGAQTAKLFKKYLEKENFSADIWYSDLENHGHLIKDIPSLIGSAQSAVLFIDKNFTYNFDSEECITALEIIEIVKRACADPNFRIFEVFLNRDDHEFTNEEKSALARILKTMEQHLSVLTKRNALAFNIYSDDEENLAKKLIPHLLPPEYYEKSIRPGSFSFGHIPTYVDIAFCDFKKNIELNDVAFSIDNRTIKTYRDIQRFPFSEKREIQNNTMISFVGADVVLSDDEENKTVLVRYQTIKYDLFNKTIQLMGMAQLGLWKIISNYQLEDEAFLIPNAMGLSLMVVTADQKLLLTKRSTQRVIRSAQYDVSIVEGLKIEGIDEDNYLESEIIRAYNEEICETTSALDIHCSALVLDKEYAQWNFVGTIFTQQTSEDILRTHATRDDTYERNEIIFVPCEKNVEEKVAIMRKYLSRFIHGKMWGMGLFTLYSTLRILGFSEAEIAEISKIQM